MRYLQCAVYAILALSISLPASAQVTDVEYTIYIDLIAQLEFGFTDSRTAAYVYVIRNHTETMLNPFHPETPISEEDYQYLRMSLAEADSTALVSFSIRARQPAVLNHAEFTNLSVQLITDDQIAMYFQGGREDPWSRFYADYPRAQGILTLSRAGISEDGRQALVFVVDEWNDLAAAGAVYLLEHKSEQWKVKGGVVFWNK